MVSSVAIMQAVARAPLGPRGAQRGGGPRDGGHKRCAPHRRGRGGGLAGASAALADLVTPNIPEAEVLCGFAIADEDAMERAARQLLDLCGGAVLVKGGHGANDANDVLALSDGALRWFRSPAIDTANTHGTGCTLSSAIAASLQRKGHGRSRGGCEGVTSPERSPPALASAAAAAPSITCGTTSSGRRGRPQDPLVLLPASVSLRFDGAGPRPPSRLEHAPSARERG